MQMPVCDQSHMFYIHVNTSSHTCVHRTHAHLYIYTHTCPYICRPDPCTQTSHLLPAYLIRKWTQTILSDWGPRPPDTTVAWVWVHR